MSTEQQEIGTAAPGNGASTAVVQAPDVEVGTLSEHPRSISAFASQAAFETAQRMARALSESDLVPKLYYHSIANCLIAMELAGRTGASVLMVMQNMKPIQGNPSWASTFLIGCVNACGRFSPMRYEFRGEEGTTQRACRAFAFDKKTGDRLDGEWITWQMAVEEGWVGRNGSKWKTMPGQMFRYRAAAWWTRVYAPEIALGMHTLDEMEDAGHVVRAGPAGTDNLDELNAQLRAAAGGSAPAAALEPEDNSPASPEQIKQLRNLLPEAREAELLSADDEEGMAGAIRRKDGPLVREWIMDIQARLARGQTSLGVDG